jgi:cyclophilin family peptidyl-prolyl cis-trans isomerase/HEAT repeat protein
MPFQLIIDPYTELLPVIKNGGERLSKLFLLGAILLSGCGDGLDDGQYQAVFDEIDNRGKHGMSSIISALDDPDPALQRLAVEGLGRFESEEHVPRIARALESQDWLVRLSAVNALGQAVFRTDGDEVADTLLEHLLVEENAEVKGGIARTLGRLSFSNQSKNQLVVNALLEMFEQGISVVERPVVLGVAMGLESMVRGLQFGTDEPPARVVRLLQELLGYTGTDGDGKVTEWESRATIRRVAILALSSLKNVEIETLIQATKDADSGVRRIAMLAMGQQLEGDLQVIEGGLSDPSPMVRMEAVKSYANRTRDMEGCQLLLSKVEDENLHVSLAALNLIGGECTGGDEFEAVLSSLISDPSAQEPHNWHRAAHALVALAEVSSERGDLLIEDFVSHQSPFARSYAARAAAITGNLDVLLGLMEDTDSNVLVHAVQALFAIEGDDIDSVLIAQLGSIDPFLILTVAQLLEGSPNSHEAIEPLVESLKRMSQERKQTYRNPRMALLERLGEFGGSRQVISLEPYLRDYDPVIANRVSEILKVWTGKDWPVDPQVLDRLPMPSRIELEQMENTVVTLHMERGGEIPVALIPDLAPTHAYRFKNLAENGQLNGLTFHRVVSNFVIQGLSPGANEYAGHSEYTRDEIGLLAHWRGTVGTSTRGRDTGDGQIFVNLIDNHNLNHDFTIFGLVRAEGMEVVDLVAEGDVVIRATVEILGSD